MGRWKPGESGNPKGKPPGTLHRATRAAQILLSGEAEALTRRCIELALAGDTLALRLCLERILPPLRHRAVKVPLPPLKGLADLPAALQVVAAAVGEGEIAPAEAESLSGMLTAFCRVLALADLEARLAALEERLKQGGSGNAQEP